MDWARRQGYKLAERRAGTKFKEESGPAPNPRPSTGNQEKTKKKKSCRGRKVARERETSVLGRGNPDHRVGN